jgi:hypothetical protein
MPQQNFTTASAPVMMLYIGGAIAQFLSAMPDATAFRYTAVRFTTFGQAWYFENFSKGATSYLGESLTYEATRNKDIHEATYVRYELPGLMNVQYMTDDDTNSTQLNYLIEVLHPDLKQAYDDVAANAPNSTGVRACVSEIHTTASDVADVASTTAKYRRCREGQPYYTDGVAIAAIKSVDFEIGGQRMDRHDKYAIYTWLMLNSGSIGVPLDMCGLAETNTTVELKKASMAFQVKYCPLVFSFCRAPSMGAPLISNMYNNLTLRMEFEPFTALICNYSGSGVSGSMGASKVFATASTTETFVMGAAVTDGTSGLGLTAMAAGTQFFTRARKYELTLTDSYARGRDLRTSNKCGYSLQGVGGTSNITDTDLVQTNFPVSIVSRAYFLGPEERTAFASNAFNQIVECCQRLTETTTQAASKTFRVDQFQNAASTLYVCPIAKTSLAYNSYFDFGGSYDYIRQRTFPAISTIELSTNGAVLYQASDESFFRMVQPYAHHSNVLPSHRRVYAMNFGIRANARGPVQANGYMNFSRTANAMITITFPNNIWATGTDALDGAVGNPTQSTSTSVQLLFIVWNYNVRFVLLLNRWSRLCFAFNFNVNYLQLYLPSFVCWLSISTLGASIPRWHCGLQVHAGQQLCVKELVATKRKRAAHLLNYFVVLFQGFLFMFAFVCVE